MRPLIQVLHGIALGARSSRKAFKPDQRFPAMHPATDHLAAVPVMRSSPDGR